MNPEDRDKEFEELLKKLNNFTQSGSFTPIHSIDTNSEEWNYAWSRLYAKPLMLENSIGSLFFPSLDDQDEETGEDWQYMGSSLKTSKTGMKYFAHGFRHRCHPKTQSRLSVCIPASPGWTPWEGK